VPYVLGLILLGLAVVAASVLMLFLVRHRDRSRSRQRRGIGSSVMLTLCCILGQPEGRGTGSSVMATLRCILGHLQSGGYFLTSESLRLVTYRICSITCCYVMLGRPRSRCAVASGERMTDAEV
jgi:hypothetical protein